MLQRKTIIVRCQCSDWRRAKKICPLSPRTFSEVRYLSGFFLPLHRIGSATAGTVPRTRRPGQPLKGGGVADRSPGKASSYLCAKKGDAAEGVKRCAWLQGTKQARPVNKDRESVRFLQGTKSEAMKRRLRFGKRYREYQKYLETPHWRNLRKQAFERDGHKCTSCGSPKRLEGHHLHYRSDFTRCTVDDVQTLCGECHKAHHRKKALERKLNRKGAGHLIRLLFTFSAEECRDVLLTDGHYIAHHVGLK